MPKSVDYRRFVERRAPLVAEEGRGFTIAARQMIVMPTVVGNEETFYLAIPEEFGGGTRMTATEVLSASDRDFPEEVWSDKILWPAIEVLAADLKDAYYDQGGYKIVEGMAVVHEDHGTGEVMRVSDKDLGDGTPAAAGVEFGESGYTETVPLHDLEVDWEYYRDESNIHRVRQ